MKKSLTHSNLKDVLTRKGYKFFTGEMSLNIVGIRAQNTDSNSFNDYLTVSFMSNGQPVTLIFPCTTDPGLHYREKPLDARGCAVVAPGQYPGLWAIGKHQGRYKALTQKGAVNVYRDDNRDQILDFDEATLSNGYFGINLHRANSERASIQVDKWSAGCQVIAAPLEFNLVMALADLSAKLYGNSFTYTLIEEGDL